MIRTLLNIIDTWLNRAKPLKALKYIRYLENLSIPIDFFYEKILLDYQKAKFCYLRGEKQGKEEMFSCAQTIEKYGFRSEAELLYQEIKQM